jgi:O-antigen/teichoic acid export membrane protein
MQMRLSAFATSWLALRSGNAIRVAGLLLAGVLINRGAEAVARVVIGRLYGDEALGLYAAATAILDVASVIAIFGLQNAVLRAYSGTPGTERGVFSASLVITGATVLTVAAGLWLAVQAGALTAIGPSALAMSCVAVALLCWLRLALSYTQALRMFGAKVAIEDSLFPLVRSAAVILLMAAGFAAPNAVAAGTAMAAALAMGLLVLWPTVGRVIRSAVREPIGWTLTRTLLTFGSPLALSAFADFFVSQLDILVLQAAMPASQLGQYAAATTVGRMLVLLFGVASYAYAPAFAASLGPDGRPTHAVFPRELEDFRFLSALLAAAISLLAPELVAILFGRAFAQASLPLIVIALGYLLVNLQGFNSYHLLLAGRSATYALSRGAVVGIGLLLYSVLVPTLGLLGAAVGSAVTVVLAASSAAFLSQRLLRTPATPPVTLLYALPVIAALLLEGQTMPWRAAALAGSVLIVFMTRRLGPRA